MTIKREISYRKKWSKNRVRSRESVAIAAIIHREVNSIRLKYGLKPLDYDHHLAFIARGHSRDMAHYNYIGHNNSLGESPTNRASRKGYRATGNYSGVGENICQLWDHVYDNKGRKYSKEADRLGREAVRIWMNSPGHRANILRKDYTCQGVGSARPRKTKGKVYLTQNFYG